MTSIIESDRTTHGKRTVTSQEEFWLGGFGEQYLQRNQVDPATRKPFLSHVLGLADGVQSICELGANRGHNLKALQELRPDLQLTGVELNASAHRELAELPGIANFHSSIQDFTAVSKYDLVFTCGVLIHIAPEDLPGVYAKLDQLSSRYVLIIEYFNPTPTEVKYRGHDGKLFKRDFASEFLDCVEGWAPAAYGFLWKRVDPAWDNSNWTLLKRCV